jgi:hypothetical protein
VTCGGFKRLAVLFAMILTLATAAAVSSGSSESARDAPGNEPTLQQT